MRFLKRFGAPALAVLALLAVLTVSVTTQQSVLLLGMNSGVARALSVSSTGAVNAVVSASSSGFSWLFGTLGNDVNAILSTATMGSTPTGSLSVYSFTTTGAGSAAQNVFAFNSTLAAGYTGTASTAALRGANSTAGGAASVNYGVLGTSDGAGASASNVAVSGVGTAAGKNVGVYGSSAGPFTTTAIPFTGGVTGIAGAFYNGTNTDDILVGSDGTTTPLEVFRIKNAGDGAFASETGDSSLQWDWTATSGGGNVRLLVSGGSSATIGTSNNVSFGLMANANERWTVNTSGHFISASDNAYSIGLTDASRPTEIFLATPSITKGTGTGLTLNNSGSVRELDYKITVSSPAYVCANTVCDVTIATLPNNTRLLTVDANLTQTFACTATCTTASLSLQLGKGAGGTEYLASIDADAATGWFGDADAELGTLMTRAAAIQGGTFNTGGTQTVVLRLTSGAGNIGNGSASNLSQGSIAVHLHTKVFP